MARVPIGHDGGTNAADYTGLYIHVPALDGDDKTLRCQQQPPHRIVRDLPHGSVGAWRAFLRWVDKGVCAYLGAQDGLP